MIVAAEIPKLIRRSLGYIGLALLAYFLIQEHLTEPATHDEFEHGHVAWLISKGKVPFIDFFEHHSGVLWQVLRVYYWIFPEGGPEVMYWGRLVSAACGLIAIGLIYRIGKILSSKNYSMLCLMLWVPSYAWGCYFNEECRTISVRPETLALPLILGSLYYFLPWQEDRKRTQCDRSLVLSIFLASIAFLITPRVAIFTAGIVFLVLLRRYESPIQHFWRFWVVLSIGPALLLILSGPANVAKWIFLFSARLVPSFSLRAWFLVYSGHWTIILAIVVSLILLFRGRGAHLRTIALFFLLSLLGLTLEQRPFQYTFNYTFLFAVFLVVSTCEFLWSKRSKWMVVGGIVVYGLLLYTIISRVDIWYGVSGKGASLQRQVEKRKIWSHLLKGETVMANPLLHPIAVEDASYYWFGYALLRAGTLEFARIKNPVLQLYSDLKSKRPALISNHQAIHVMLMLGLSRSGDDPPDDDKAPIYKWDYVTFIQRRGEFCAFMAENYQMLSWAFIRKDFAPCFGRDGYPLPVTEARLKELMEGPEQIMQQNQEMDELPRFDREGQKLLP